jgi:hypothetical protein
MSSARTYGTRRQKGRGVVVRLSAVDWSVAAGVLANGDEVAVLTIYTGGAAFELPVVFPRRDADDVCRAFANCFTPPEPPAVAAKAPLLAVKAGGDDDGLRTAVACVGGAGAGNDAPRSPARKRKRRKR